MPFMRKRKGFERAKSTGHVKLADNPLVQERLKKFKVHNPDEHIEIDKNLLVDAKDLGKPGTPFQWTIAFDGSRHEVPVREKYPSIRVGYIQIAGVLVDLGKMLEQGQEHLVDPTIIKESITDALVHMVLPGSNTRSPDMRNVKDSWRAEIYNLFDEQKVEDTSLNDIFKCLVQLSKHCSNNGVKLSNCPAYYCDQKNLVVPFSGGKCPSCGVKLYPTDALRIYEEVTEEQANLTALGRLMSIGEQLTMLAYLYYFNKRRPSLLSTVAFIMDGPLAIFGPPAWTHTPITAFINKIRTELALNNLRGPFVIGILHSTLKCNTVVCDFEGCFEIQALSGPVV